MVTFVSYGRQLIIEGFSVSYYCIPTTHRELAPSAITAERIPLASHIFECYVHRSIGMHVLRMKSGTTISLTVAMRLVRVWCVLILWLPVDRESY